MKKTINLVFKGDTLTLAEPWSLDGFEYNIDNTKNKSFMKIVDPDWIDPPRFKSNMDDDEYERYDECHSRWIVEYAKKSYNFIFPVGTVFTVFVIGPSWVTLKTTLCNKKITLSMVVETINGMVVEEKEA